MKLKIKKMDVIAALYFIMLSALISLAFCPASLNEEFVGIACAIWVIAEWIDAFT